ncbi:MICOS complex subunit MIC13 homolog QIL1 [Drosophila albomicans]|uniref:MICOS complex subunit MIC13 n=1 Tax=Drosophila albomicans TaxID=7291 RepID=A0A9C6T8P3_DROAB|nr:MICOS complex subunit MIC13 homolog QIL1 [Drosophila albomicans]
MMISRRFNGSMAWLLTKIAIVAGTVWATRELGVWDSPDRTTLIYEDAKCQMQPYVEKMKQKYCNVFCSVNKNSTKTWRESWIDGWNDSVRTGFIEISRMPQYCSRFTEDVQDTLNQLINGKPPAK